MKSKKMVAAAELAKVQRISREVFSYSHTKEGKYKAWIKTSGYVVDQEVDMVDCNMRTEQSFYFIPSEGLSEELAIEILLTMATYSFLGEDYQVVGDICIEELKGGKTKPTKAAAKATAKEKPTAKAEEEATPEPDREVKQEEKKAAPARKAPAKTAAPKKPKTIAYDRSQEEHKKQFGALLNDAEPNWGEDEGNLKIAQGLSMELAGKPFLDSKGEVLAEVIEMITDAFNKPAVGVDAL